MALILRLASKVMRSTFYVLVPFFIFLYSCSQFEVHSSGLKVSTKSLQTVGLFYAYGMILKYFFFNLP